MIKIVAIALIMASFLFVSYGQVSASACSPQNAGNCVDGKRCECQEDSFFDECYLKWDDRCGGGVGVKEIGSVKKPDFLRLYDNKIDSDYGGQKRIGIVPFASRLINIFNIIAGIFVMFQFIIAGYTYIISNGDASAHKQIAERLTYAIIGIIIIISSYTLAGLIGLVFFSDSTYILQPILKSAVN